MTIARRILLGLILLSVFAGVSAGAARALNQSQGDRYRATAVDTGTRAYLAGTGHNNNPSDNEDIVSSVGVQTYTPNNPDPGCCIIQIGEIDTTSSSTDNCGSSETAVFLETETSGTHYVCHILGSISAFGNGGLFDVVYSGGWRGYWNSQLKWGPNTTLGFSSGYAIARAEAVWTSTGPDLNMTWGPSGYTAWQHTTDNGNTYNTIDTSYGTQGPLDVWTLGGTPSPFTIYYSG